nr:hypothetical protein [Tanacetum cinerariifolium]
EEKDRYIDLVEKSIKDIIKDEVKSQLPQIPPKEVSDFATPVIQSAINKSLENFTKPKQPQESTDPDWNVGKTPQQGPIQSWLITLAATADKPLKTFNELMSTPIDFSAYIMNGLNITNLTQETLLGPAFKLLKGTRTNFAELEYDFEECYKALSEKLDWDNPEGGDYPFYLTKPLPLVMKGNHQMVPVGYFFNNDLKLPGIEDMLPNIWSPVKASYDKYALWGISHWRKNSVWVPFPDAGSGSFWLGDVDLLLVSFDSQLKIIDSLLNNHASGEHSQCYSKVVNIIAREIGEPILNNKDQHVLDVTDTKSWEVTFLKRVKFVISSSYFNLSQIPIP